MEGTYANLESNLFVLLPNISKSVDISCAEEALVRNTSTVLESPSVLCPWERTKDKKAKSKTPKRNPKFIVSP